MKGKYIKCDCCGQRIYFGDTIYYRDGYCGTYCSADCFACVHGDIEELTEEHAENCMCKVYDDDKTAKRKAEIKSQIEELQSELKSLEK